MKNKIHNFKKLKFLLILTAAALTFNCNFKNNFFKVKATQNVENKNENPNTQTNSDEKKLEEIKKIIEALSENSKPENKENVPNNKKKQWKK